MALMLEFISWLENKLLWPLLSRLGGKIVASNRWYWNILEAVDYVLTRLTGHNMLERIALFHCTFPGSRKISPLGLVYIDRCLCLYPNIGKTSPILKGSLEQVENLRDCKKGIVFEAKTKYSHSAHQDLLCELWRLYAHEKSAPEIPGEEWKMLGFQGVDPATDFRGMGVLGLNQCLFFAQKNPSLASEYFEAAQVDSNWFYPAIFSINVTGHVYDLLTSGLLDQYLFMNGTLFRDTVDGLYCKIFTSLCDRWLQSGPLDIMQFPYIFSQIKQDFQQELK